MKRQYLALAGQLSYFVYRSCRSTFLLCSIWHHDGWLPSVFTQDQVHHTYNLGKSVSTPKIACSAKPNYCNCNPVLEIQQCIWSFTEKLYLQTHLLNISGPSNSQYFILTLVAVDQLKQGCLANLSF